MPMYIPIYIHIKVYVSMYISISISMYLCFCISSDFSTHAHIYTYISKTVYKSDSYLQICTKRLQHITHTRNSLQQFTQNTTFYKIYNNIISLYGNSNF